MSSSDDAACNRSAVAAVDLGSNSFHLVVGREGSGRIDVVDKLRERVALAEGLGAGGRLDAVAQARALGCLERFGERLQSVAEDRKRAVGTATFRKLRDGGEFIQRASDALGMEIEVLPGREEARLVYLGVAHTIGGGQGRRLVVDIGGGSTECILGERFRSDGEDSLAMGCVTWTRRFFPGACVDEDAMEQAILAGRAELEPISTRYRSGNWDHAIGSSGTIRSVGKILAAQGWTDGTVTREGLERLRRHLVDARRADKVDLASLRPDRRGVLAGGVAVLSAVFIELDIEKMRPSKGALREGVLHDLVGRIHDEDVRERSVIRFAERFGVDLRYAERVRRTTCQLLEQVMASHEIGPADSQLVGWAAMLHATGLAVSYSSYHKHGAYLVENADLAGFSREDREQLALLVRCQRHTLRPELLAGLTTDQMLAMRALIPPLRIALRLHRDRTGAETPIPHLVYAGSRIRLTFPDGWLDAHPLARTDLDEERRLLAPMGIVLECR